MNIDFDKIKNSIAKTALKAKTTSENMIEIAKSKYKLAEIKSNINDKYMEIGKLVYESDDEDVTSKIEMVCAQISELKSKEEDLETIVNDIMNKKPCPECGEKVDKNYTYCPKCGVNFTEE